jgi:DNA-binding transcriptional ArsR family regulator
VKSRHYDPHADSTRLARILFALADPVRLRMLNLMTGGEVSSKDIVRVLRAGAEVVSRHITSLQSGGLISTRRKGRTWHYLIRRDGTRNDLECQVIQLVFSSFRTQPDMQADLALLKKISEQRSKPKVRKRRKTAGSAQAGCAPAVNNASSYIAVATQAHPSVILQSAEIPSTEHPKA